MSISQAESSSSTQSNQNSATDFVGTVDDAWYECKVTSSGHFNEGKFYRRCHWACGALGSFAALYLLPEARDLIARFSPNPHNNTSPSSSSSPSPFSSQINWQKAGMALFGISVVAYAIDWYLELGPTAQRHYEAGAKYNGVAREADEIVRVSAFVPTQELQGRWDIVRERRNQVEADVALPISNGSHAKAKEQIRRHVQHRKERVEAIKTHAK
eukprot:CAMPEP_0201552210 /NCGR_PEP_ID=MMETSP0173_2-20130828/14560_1 /ASSEMBLY_ACC=CAM_ASM_000268 /TAXON_ID=218659 /ORGANISM="Vexillifera sp., Strain DIVA3 564/2" /LENGTH=213 /DNA_ID=CAMNT_0047962651 /DNA_START=29 /DNA_END=670 /DNA_ORIENTATION=-